MSTGLTDEVFRAIRTSAREDRTPTARFGEFGEQLLEMLDSFYHIEDIDDTGIHMRQVEMMCSIVREAFNRGERSGLEKATRNIKATIWGADV